MSSVAAPPRPAQRVAGRLAATRDAARAREAPLTALAIAALVVVSLVLRTRALDAGFWIDEALAVGISSSSFLDIPSVLRMDGSPPLYYLLLNLWMQAFGTTETATHVLSLIFALLFVPAAFWAGRSLWGPRAGWLAVILGAINPFLTYYAQETRMYALQGLLGLVACAAFLHVYARRDRRYLPLFVAALTAMLYTHNWALFVAAASVAALGMLWRLTAPEERRALVRDAAIGFGAVALLYLPWLPTLAVQVLHTGAPWSSRPGIDQLLSYTGVLLGGSTPSIALLLVAGSGLATLVRDRRDHAAAALLVIASGAILLAFVVSWASPGFATRYFAAFVGPAVLLAAVGLAFAGRLGLVCFVIVASFWFDPRTTDVETKSNVRALGTSIRSIVTSGDLVVSPHPEALPLVAYYFPRGVRYADALGPVEDPRFFDWTDALDRLRAARPTPVIGRLMGTMRPGQELVLVMPILRTGFWRAPWTKLVRRRALQWELRLNRHPRLRREAVVPVFDYGPLPKGARAIVYRVR